MDNIIDIPLHPEECIICFEETEEFLFFPCQHKVCSTCFPKLHQCPLCQPITKIRVQRIEIRERSDAADHCKLCCSAIIIMMFCIWCFHIVGMF